MEMKDKPLFVKLRNSAGKEEEVLCVPADEEVIVCKKTQVIKFHHDERKNQISIVDDGGISREKLNTINNVLKKHYLK